MSDYELLAEHRVEELQDTLQQVRHQCNLSKYSPIKGRAHLAKIILMILDGSDLKEKTNNE